jgi:ATP-binding cassette subfamily B (MDR/TAP) protein 6
MALGRIVNILVPMQYKHVIDSLGGLANNVTLTWSQKGDFTDIEITPIVRDIPYGSIILFVALRFLQGGVGLLSSMEDFLWIPVGQVTTRQISVKMFHHLHR